MKLFPAYLFELKPINRLEICVLMEMGQVEELQKIL